MTIELNKEVETLAITAAMSLGFQSVAAFVEAAVREKASMQEVDDKPSNDADQWIEKLNAIGARHRVTGYSVDDSRESIYPNRS